MIVGNPVIVSSGGGTVSKPSYLISDGSTVSTFYFNTELSLSPYLAALSYPGTDPVTGLDVCALGLGYFYAVDLTNGDYALVWNDGTNVVPVYSTTSVPSYGVTSAGWQIASYSPSSSVTVAMSDVMPALRAIMDIVVAKSAVAFGTKKTALSVSQNGTYSAPSGTLYNSVSVSVSGGGSKPQLNAPSVTLTDKYTLTVTNPATNGNFVTGYKILVSGVETYTTQNTTYDLSGLSVNTAPVRVKAVGNDFEDSAASNSVTFYKYFDVEMYDDDGTTLLSTENVRYGSMPSYVPSKSGWGFVRWEDQNGNTVTSVTSADPLYAVYTQSFVIEAGTYAVKSGLTDETKDINIDINFTWTKKNQPSVTAVGTALYRSKYGSVTTIFCTKQMGDSNRMMPFGYNSTMSKNMWLPQNFMYYDNGWYKIVVGTDTNVTQTQKEQFDYFFRKLTT
ncbi:MAG: hypothetical protein IJS45_06005 [Clostridia bacterium]|nr:hypothetical protein [Clostridia bacterium]